VHIDHSAREVTKRAHQIHGTATDALLATHHIRVINLWRPLYETIHDRPLCICDGSTVAKDDLIEVAIVMGDIERETVNVLWTERQRWFYLSQQEPWEMWMFKTFDSDANVKAACKSLDFSRQEILVCR